jgi:hypothetical protein
LILRADRLYPLLCAYKKEAVRREGICRAKDKKIDVQWVCMRGSCLNLPFEERALIFWDHPWMPGCHSC